MNDMEFTIKIINTPDHTLFLMGRSYYFTNDRDTPFQYLYDKMNEIIKECIILPDFLTFSLITYEKNKINLNDKISSSFSTDHTLDIIDRNENNFYLYFHRYPAKETMVDPLSVDLE
jgi:hypothetical protein